MTIKQMFFSLTLSLFFVFSFVADISFILCLVYTSLQRIQNSLP